MDNILKQALLYDFYGELLTVRQKEIYEQFVLEDLSLGEIAGNAGISRQAVHDLIKRCDKILRGYEDKLHLVSKFLTVKEKLHEINEILDKDQDGNTMKLKADIRRIADEIIEEL
ncbi:MAG: YlxM family DNA-binding protein [Dorea sp.]|nr:YlxM family DNA-binding protein [Dorea sp.]